MCAVGGVDTTEGALGTAGLATIPAAGVCTRGEGEAGAAGKSPVGVAKSPKSSVADVRSALLATAEVGVAKSPKSSLTDGASGAGAFATIAGAGRGEGAAAATAKSPKSKPLPGTEPLVVAEAVGTGGLTATAGALNASCDAALTAGLEGAAKSPKSKSL